MTGTDYCKCLLKKNICPWWHIWSHLTEIIFKKGQISGWVLGCLPCKITCANSCLCPLGLDKNRPSHFKTGQWAFCLCWFAICVTGRGPMQISALKQTSQWTIFSPGGLVSLNSDQFSSPRVTNLYDVSGGCVCFRWKLCNAKQISVAVMWHFPGSFLPSASLIPFWLVTAGGIITGKLAVNFSAKIVYIWWNHLLVCSVQVNRAWLTERLPSPDVTFFAGSKQTSPKSHKLFSPRLCFFVSLHYAYQYNGITIVD